MSATSNRYQVSIEADPTLPIIRMTRDFDATPAQLMRAHTDGWPAAWRPASMRATPSSTP